MIPDITDDSPLVRQCPDPDIPVGIIAPSIKLFVNSEVSYVTTTGYLFDKGGRSRSSICLSDGHWSGDVLRLRREIIIVYYYAMISQHLNALALY